MAGLSVRFASEPLTDALWAECFPLLQSHWGEVAHFQDIPLEPSRELYDLSQSNGTLRLFTVRESASARGEVLKYCGRPCSVVSADATTVTITSDLEPGLIVLPIDHLPAEAAIPSKLVGYAVFFARSNPHYSASLQAVQDVLYLDPSARGSTGSRFIDWCDTQLQSEGVQVVYHHVKAKPGLNFGPMLERKGYELVDHIYAKRLDRPGRYARVVADADGSNQRLQTASAPNGAFADAPTYHATFGRSETTRYNREQIAEAVGHDILAMAEQAAARANETSYEAPSGTIDPETFDGGLQLRDEDCGTTWIAGPGGERIVLSRGLPILAMPGAWLPPRAWVTLHGRPSADLRDAPALMPIGEDAG